ncbi:MAG: histidinol-phosphatase HisJ [Spirochaetaceae bacterium]
MKTNYHTHCFYCDGKGDPRGYVEEAIKRGFSSLGFSSHAPLKEDNDWTLKENNVNKYIENIRALKEEFRDEIDIHLGLEIDYYPDENRFEYFKNLGLEYSIGSVHQVKFKNSEVYYSVDENPEVFDYVTNTIFGSIEDFTIEYYSQVRALIKQGGFNILGHFDLIKKFNKDFRYFTEEESWYKKQVYETLDLLENRDIIVEVNTGAISRGVQDTPYPSKWILEECFKRDIKICLNSDVHASNNIECYFDEALIMIKNCGFKKLHTPFEIITI